VYHTGGVAGNESSCATSSCSISASLSISDVTAVSVPMTSPERVMMTSSYCAVSSSLMAAECSVKNDTTTMSLPVNVMAERNKIFQPIIYYTCAPYAKSWLHWFICVSRSTLRAVSAWLYLPFVLIVFSVFFYIMLLWLCHSLVGNLAYLRLMRNKRRC